MINSMKIDLMSTDVSGGTIALISIGGIIGAVILFFMIKFCVNCEKRTGKSSFSWLKIIIIAVGPALLTAKEMLNFDIDNKLSIIVTIIAIVVCFVWNMLTYGLIYGIMYTIVQTLGGIIAGISVIAVVAVAVVAFIVAASCKDDGDPTTSDEVYDVSTNELYRIEKKSGNNIYITRNGNRTILRHDSYGDWIDNSLNRYKYSS